MTIVESFSFGTPVIGSELGGIPELIENNKNGFLFRYGNVDSLNEVLKKALNLSETDYNILATNALRFAKSNFDKEIHYQSLMNIYEMTIERHPSDAITQF